MMIDPLACEGGTNSGNCRGKALPEGERPVPPIRCGGMTFQAAGCEGRRYNSAAEPGTLSFTDSVRPSASAVEAGANLVYMGASLGFAAQGRRLVFESSFPVGLGSLPRRGVPGTTWVPINQETYDACRDPRDYRPSR